MIKRMKSQQHHIDTLSLAISLRYQSRVPLHVIITCLLINVLHCIVLHYCPSCTLVSYCTRICPFPRCPALQLQLKNLSVFL